MKEVGHCPNCGEVSSEGSQFEWDYGPRCPQCGAILRVAWNSEPNRSVEQTTEVSER